MSRLFQVWFSHTGNQQEAPQGLRAGALLEEQVEVLPSEGTREARSPRERAPVWARNHGR